LGASFLDTAGVDERRRLARRERGLHFHPGHLLELHQIGLRARRSARRSRSQYQGGRAASDQHQQGMRNRTSAHVILLSAKTRITQYSDARQKITQIHYSHDYNSSSARFSYASENLLGDPLARRFPRPRRVRPAGSSAGAADRLFPLRLPGKCKRLEAALGAELLDRSVKPPRLKSLGSRVLEQARDLLQRTEALKSLTSRDAEPHGLLRIGLAHALAEGTLIEPIRAVTEKYPKVRVR